MLYKNREKTMKIGISACSNGHLPEWQDQITELSRVMKRQDYRFLYMTF